MAVVLFKRAAPSKAKPIQINPNKFAWICLVLFVRIGTFQGVTAIPNKNFLLPFCSPSLPVSGCPAKHGLDPRHEFQGSTDSLSRKTFVRIFGAPVLQSRRPYS